MKDKAGVLICSLIAFSACFGPDEDFSIIVLPDTQFYSASMTGHPVVVVPNGFTGEVTPTGIAFMGSIYREDKLLMLAKAYQEATGFHERHPVLRA